MGRLKRHGLIVWAIFWTACGADSFVAWPRLQPETHTLIVGRTCDRKVELEVLDPAELPNRVERLSDCRTRAGVAVLEYAAEPKDLSLSPGKLRSGELSECATHSIPTPDRISTLSGEEESVEFAVTTSLPDPLDEFRYRIDCPCEPGLRIWRQVQIPAPAQMVLVMPLGPGALLIVATHEVGTSFFRYDLDTLELLHTSSVGLSRASAAGPGGDFYFGDAVGRVWRYEPPKALTLHARLPRAADVISLAVSADEGPPEIFALCKPAGLFRVRGSEILELPFEREAEPSSRKNHVIWLARGSVIATPPESQSVYFVHERDVLRRSWELSTQLINEIGQPQAMGLVAGFGVLAATFLQQVVRVDEARVGAWEEIRSLDGSRMDPVAGWFERFIEYPPGFALTHDKKGIARFYPDFGFCGQQTFGASDVNFGSVAVIDRTLVLGGLVEPEDIDSPTILALSPEE